MPRTRYTVRLPPALEAAVQERLRAAGIPFAVLIREALSAYLAATPPPGTPPPADSTDTLRELQIRLAALTTRVEMLDYARTPGRQEPPEAADTMPTAANRDADRLPPPAATPRAQPRGQRKLTPRQARALRDKRRRGVPIPALMEEYGLARATVFRYLQSEKR